MSYVEVGFKFVSGGLRIDVQCKGGYVICVGFYLGWYTRSINNVFDMSGRETHLSFIYSDCLEGLL